MAKMMQVEEVENLSEVKEKPEVFPARYETDAQGRRFLVVSARKEIIKKPNVTQDVIMHLPTLDLVNKFKEENI